MDGKQHSKRYASKAAQQSKITDSKKHLKHLKDWAKNQIFWREGKAGPDTYIIILGWEHITEKLWEIIKEVELREHFAR